MTISIRVEKKKTNTEKKKEILIEDYKSWLKILRIHLYEDKNLSMKDILERKDYS